jgi:hypothetical protein
MASNKSDLLSEFFGNFSEPCLRINPTILQQLLCFCAFVSLASLPSSGVASVPPAIYSLVQLQGAAASLLSIRKNIFRIYPFRRTLLVLAPAPALNGGTVGILSRRFTRLAVN